MNVETLLLEAEKLAGEDFAQVERTSFLNQGRVLDAFRAEKVSDYHLHGSTGYGYGDSGREVIESLYSRLFGAEKALVRSQFASGTHALACALFGLLRPGDELLLASGLPYDTLHKVIGLNDNGSSSLKAWGISHRLQPLLPNGDLDFEGLEGAIGPKTRVVYLQRSRGYAWRKALSLDDIARVVDIIKNKNRQVICLVDNCYGEFVADKEPCHVGVDLVAGSLTKNPGGGLALSGGYVAGSKELVDLTAERLYAPGIGDRVGASTSFNRGFLQGLFMAPATVEASLKGAILLAHICRLLGLETSPLPGAQRSDIIQAVRLPTREALIAFCQGIQLASPIDSHVTPEPGKLPGYEDPVIMAAGTFVLGASSELTADAPLRAPFTAYVQGGLSYGHVRAALGIALVKVWPEIVSRG